MKLKIITTLISIVLAANCTNNIEDLTSQTQEYLTDISAAPAEQYLSKAEITTQESETVDQLRLFHPEREDRILHLQTRLDLTEEQVQNITPILDELDLKIQTEHEAFVAEYPRPEPPSGEPGDLTQDQIDARNAAHEAHQAMDQRIQEYKDAAREEIRPYLSDEQNLEFDAMVAEHEANRQNHHAPDADQGSNGNVNPGQPHPPHEAHQGPSQDNRPPHGPQGSQGSQQPPQNETTQEVI